MFCILSLKTYLVVHSVNTSKIVVTAYYYSTTKYEKDTNSVLMYGVFYLQGLCATSL